MSTLPSVPPPSSPDSPLLTAYLQGRDAPCPHCHYNLRDLSSPRCPECGLALHLQIGAADLPLSRWLLTTIPLVLAGGTGLYLWSAIFLEGLPDPPDAWIVACFSATSFLMLPPLLLRRRFLRLPRSRQSAFAATSLILVTALYCWDFYVFALI